MPERWRIGTESSQNIPFVAAAEKDGALQILLQKRSADKPSFPNCYDISSAGHIPAGGEFASSALRELKRRAGNYRGGKRSDRL